MDETTTTDVIAGDSPASEVPVSTGAVSAPADQNGESAQQSATQTEGQAQTTDEAGQPAAAFMVPENDDDLKGHENDPHVQAIIQMRGELRTRDKLLDDYKPLNDWKPLVETIGDPALAMSSFELANALYTPSDVNPSGFDPKPFLDKVEADSPGTVDQLFSTICSFQIQDKDGNPTTVVRELYKAHGLNPDRVDEYRNIDSLRASGVVSDADLAKIPERYRDAFKSLSQPAREDLLEVIESKPLVAEESLRNAQDALEARQYRERETEAKAGLAQQQEAQFKQQVETAVTEGVNGKIEAWVNSIHQTLSQWKPSADDAINSQEYAKILGTISALQSPSPAYRKIAERALGGPEAIAGFDELVNQWSANYSAQVTYEQMGQKDSVPAKRAAAMANQAEQRILLKLNDFAKRLSEPTNTRMVAQSQQTATQLATAQGRFVPSGNGNTQPGFQNPYSQNPHPVGSQEYYAFNRKIDREYKLDNAAVFQ